jgi:hypothetical protein
VILELVSFCTDVEFLAELLANILAVLPRQKADDFCLCFWYLSDMKKLVHKDKKLKTEVRFSLFLLGSQDILILLKYRTHQVGLH